MNIDELAPDGFGPITRTIYTVIRIRKNNTFYGPKHASVDGEVTVCGQKCDHNWYILNNTWDGEVDCEECLKICKEKAYHQL